MKLLALATSDWHLNNIGILDRRFPVEGDFEFSLLQIANYLNNFNDVPLFLLGDIFDKDVVNGVAIEKVIKFDNYLSRKVKCYFVLGQHDPKSPQILDKIKTKNIDFIYSDKKVLSIEDINFYFLDYCKNVEDFLHLFNENTLSKTNVLCTHQVWEEFVPYVNTTWKLENIPDHYNVIFSGDYHNFTSITKQNKTLYSCGSIVFTDFGICNHVRNIYAIYKNYADDSLYVKELPIYCRVIKKYKLSSQDDLLNLEKELSEFQDHKKILPSLLKSSIFYLHVDHNLYRENEEKFNKLFSQEDIVNINFFSKENEIYISQNNTDVSTKTFDEALKMYCKYHNIEDRFIDYSKELWKNYNIEQTLDAIVLDLKKSFS